MGRKGRFVMTRFVFLALITLATVASGADRKASSMNYSYSRVYNSRGQRIATVKTGRDSRDYIGPQGKVIATERFSPSMPYGKQKQSSKRK
jgi:hypothetical protein